jgi:hypothetical protein
MLCAISPFLLLRDPKVEKHVACISEPREPKKGKGLWRRKAKPGERKGDSDGELAARVDGM